MWFTLTSRLLLQPPLCKLAGFIRLVSRRSFLTFNSGGAKLLKSHKQEVVGPQTHPRQSRFGGMKKLEFLRHGMNMGTCRLAVADVRWETCPFLSAYPQLPQGLAYSQKGGMKLRAFGSLTCPENCVPWVRAGQTDARMSHTNKQTNKHTNKPPRSTKQTLPGILPT